MKPERVDPALTTWAQRLARANELREGYEAYRDTAVDAIDGDTPSALLNSLDQRAGVGARHHVVPKFLLERWAGADGQVQVYSRVEQRIGTRNIRDLAIRDFYTFIDTSGERNSLLESLLGTVETEASVVIRNMLNPFSKLGQMSPADLATLAQFAAFQAVRTPRRRREQELKAEWYAKTMAQGRVSDEYLRQISIVPHQNESVGMLGQSAEAIMPFLLARPLALVTLARPLLLIGDEPVIINDGEGEVHHHPDCFLTDAQIEARFAKERRKKRKRKQEVGRVIHISSTVPRGVGTAVEVVLPISPRSALVWGPLGDENYPPLFEREVLAPEDSERFASIINAATCEHALDWIVTTPRDAEFGGRAFPSVGPLLRVCDGENAAAIAVNAIPSPIRPRRLTRN